MRRSHPGAQGREGRLSERRALPIDAAVVPGLLLLLARDLALHDPPRVLAWRLSHDVRLAQLAGWLGPLVPAPSGALDRDPVALLLSALATLSALVYATLAALGLAARARAATIALAATLLIVAPTLAFVGVGAAAERPYGQDGGVVQLPLAIDKILAGQSPYGADYSGTILARQARVSSFWDELGGNPILHHHAYLPGTHLLMAPFQLVSRAALGFFDPRLVTLLFYALSVVLASRLPVAPASRLAAAGAAALNPLAYWHQIFGANDVVFVALLLGVVLLARSGRLVAAGALLGLACATKQLAWPFAPFLLVSLSGARSFRELLTSATWRRLIGPLAAFALVLAAVVSPVAALDWHAFWGDIVVYNVGLPGGDNYPLGGTPGFGAANFLIYFGRVASLRDYFPFSVFYVLLVPLGILLARSQLRDGRAEWTLVTGSTALVASIYFSRVVHPNYLVPAAILLPIAVLACRAEAQLAVVPLLLLGVAVETVESGLYRSAWEQVAGTGLVARAGGVVSALLPHAGPQLTRDPLGLLFGALAAGVAVAYLAAAVAGGGPRLRAVLQGVAVGVVVAVPTLVLVGIGDRTGIVRAQDPAVVQAAADARRLASARSPYTPPPETIPRGREAFSSSFRLDPPAEFEPERPLLPPGPSLVVLVSGWLGPRDLRLPALLALLGLASIVAASARGAAREAALALVLVSPPIALGLPLGSPAALTCLALAAAWLAGRRSRPGLAGAFAGLACALDHRALLAAAPLLVAVPLLAAGSAARGAGRRRMLLSCVAAYGLVVLPVALLDPAAFFARLRSPDVGAGLGLFNLFAYRGLESTGAARFLATSSPVLGLALALALARRTRSGGVASALGALVAVVLAPALPADAVAVPLVLLALAAVEPASAAGSTPEPVAVANSG